MSQHDPIVIVSAARTALGGFQGSLSSMTAPELGAVAIKAAVERASLKSEDIQEVLMGCVLHAGLGQAPARQAALGAGLAQSTQCTTISKVCGSGMKAIMFAHDMLQAGTQDVIVSGGMESMTNAPYLMPKARSGYRMGHQQVLDHMFFDGLEDAYDKGKLMGTFAEQCAGQYSFTRQQQDEFAIQSTLRSQNAIANKAFEWEITPVSLVSKTGAIQFTIDEQPGNAKIEKIPTLKPAFAKDGTVTAANSSSISDGAAALVLMRESTAKAKGLKPIAKIVGIAGHARQPAQFTTAPVGAMQSLFAKTGWTKSDVDLFEINEAFAVVTMAAIKELDLDHNKVNVNGGACALGHPIGASGARIVVTLIGALRTRGLKRGVASLCIGGGEATAMAIEMM